MKLPDSSGLPVINLRPGELHVAREPTIITTLLGSCVSVCLFNPEVGMGAMCHGVLPFPRSAIQKHADSFHFVETSVDFMIRALGERQKTENRRMEAKLFGGANVISLSACPKCSPTVGAQNIEAARASLRRHEVPILVQRVGGDQGCKLYFYSHTGEVFLRSLRRYSFAGTGNGKR